METNEIEVLILQGNSQEYDFIKTFINFLMIDLYIFCMLLQYL